MPRGGKCPIRLSAGVGAGLGIESTPPANSWPTWRSRTRFAVRVSPLNAAAHAEVGGFDPSYRYVVDWDFWLRVARTRPVVWLARPTVSIRWHLASETHRFKTGTADLDETVRLLAELFEADGPSLLNGKQLRTRANRRLARAFLNRAHVAFQGR